MEILSHTLPVWRSLPPSAIAHISELSWFPADSVLPGGTSYLLKRKAEEQLLTAHHALQNWAYLYIRGELAIPHGYSKSHKNPHACPPTQGLYHDQGAASPPRKFSRSWQLTCPCVPMWSRPTAQFRLLFSCDWGSLHTSGRQRRHGSIKAKFIKGHQDYAVALGLRKPNSRSCLYWEMFMKTVTSLYCQTLQVDMHW